MLFTSTTQYVVLFLLLVVGWLFGLASHPGGKKWRAAFNEERASHARSRSDAETDIRNRNDRIAELEQENATMRADLDRGRVVRSSGVATSAAQPAFARPAADRQPKRGWFSWAGQSDDLSRIRGLDADAETKLRAEGVTRFADVASLNDTDAIALEQHLGLPAGFIQREQWREQAVLLADNRAQDHAARFSPRT